MDIREEKLRDEAANASLIALNGNFLFPWIERKIQETITQMGHEYREGAVDHLKIAYITALRDMKTELERMAKKAGNAVVKLKPQL